MISNKKEEIYSCHNPYFSRWFSAIEDKVVIILLSIMVTILILVDGFLQSVKIGNEKIGDDTSQSLF